MSLFDPFSIGNLNFKNRIIVPPSEYLAQRDGRISQNIFEYNLTLAKQGAGAIILDSAYISRQGKAFQGQLGISEEDHISGLSNIVKMIKEEGTVVGIRIGHAGGRTSEKVCGEQPVAPTQQNYGKEFDLCREIEEDDIEEICLLFAHAAERAEEAGFDFIEINAAQQMLIDQFINARFNMRDDEFGGEIDNRLRFLTMIIKKINERIQGNLPVSVYFSIHDKIETGLSYDEFKFMIKTIEDAGASFFHPLSVHVMNRFFDEEKTLLDHVTELSKKPVIIEGNIKSTSVLREVFQSDLATLYCLDKVLFTRHNWYQFLHKKILS